jgi:uncharacterized protein (DUF433 family)
MNDGGSDVARKPSRPDHHRSRDLFADYPDLEKEDFRAAYLYASRLIRTKQIGHDTA